MKHGFLIGSILLLAMMIDNKIREVYKSSHFFA